MPSKKANVVETRCLDEVAHTSSHFEQILPRRVTSVWTEPQSDFYRDDCVSCMSFCEEAKSVRSRRHARPTGSECENKPRRNSGRNAAAAKVNVGDREIWRFSHGDGIKDSSPEPASECLPVAEYSGMRKMAPRRAKVPEGEHSMKKKLTEAKDDYGYRLTYSQQKMNSNSIMGMMRPSVALFASKNYKSSGHPDEHPSSEHWINVTAAITEGTEIAMRMRRDVPIRNFVAILAQQLQHPKSELVKRIRLFYRPDQNNSDSGNDGCGAGYLPQNQTPNALKLPRHVYVEVHLEK